MHITTYRFTLTTHDIYGFSNICTFTVKQQFKRIALDGILLADMEGRSVHFNVPAKSKGFKMEFLVKNGNRLSFKVLDAAGKVHAEKSLANKGAIVDIKREPTSKDEVWILKIEKSAEPFNLRFGGDVLPVIFDVREAGLRQQ